jgi:hypothetical protein
MKRMTQLHQPPSRTAQATAPILDSTEAAKIRDHEWGEPYDRQRRGHVKYEAINFSKKFGLFAEQWQPKVIAEMNDYQFKVVRLKGDSVWHDHKETDETFIVMEGF